MDFINKLDAYEQKLVKIKSQYKLNKNVFKINMSLNYRIYIEFFSKRCGSCKYLLKLSLGNYTVF